ncbi:hypothetical protein HRR83_005476 [Exophiala dermatitidis]|uniref:O-acetyltransferase n=2 Tax=Exophiala dermatitidis TaxID=5970 RepID=H6C4E2_EXODN|nr:O-acetyltransferase [Exophiala dermatitidis NIH/UT8656]KAJ4516172.1 hypothetical protein HRR74_005329 [Exophiala dermatitidis]EHY57615.1 O-acetyltransferase [Exophiala dermatitidis NIH/UT8656]KAJ4518422.1 hypothetical protein HRR73_004003 [Exophiala dermatitidis]KAJ4533916.1 hypothetical protein HRR76_005867 [Exophiala dermatitidis]KAJ4550073.1 hypothetical protein HRR77_003553 [Exophiala dermatitidis]
MGPATEKSPDLIQLARSFNHIPWCDEFERMISGMLYNPNHPDLVRARVRCRNVSEDYNRFSARTLDSPDQIFDARLKLLKEIVGGVGEGTFVEAPFTPDYGCNVVIGRDCFFNFNLTILDTSLVIIGDRVQMGPGVSIYTATHETSILSRRKYVEFGLPVRIGDDCWIGGQAIILPGVTIGQGCTIGAGSVVTKDVPDFSVAVGSPCRVIRTVQSAEEEEADENNPYRNMTREF